MQGIAIGVDPHELSATIEVVDAHEAVLATGRFDTDKAGDAAMRKHVAAWPERTWAVEGSNVAGAGGRRACGQRAGEACRPGAARPDVDSPSSSQASWSRCRRRSRR
jgi:hypothetical protein